MQGSRSFISNRGHPLGLLHRLTRETAMDDRGVPMGLIAFLRAQGGIFLRWCLKMSNPISNELETVSLVS